MDNPILNAGVTSQSKMLSPKYIKSKYRPHYGVHTNALLRRAQWEEIDAEVQDVMRQPIVGVSDLVSNGLVKSLKDIGVYLSTYEQLGDMSPATVTMHLTSSNGIADRATFTPQSIPVPVISKPFFYDGRQLAASRREGGEGIDTTSVRTATIKVREQLESLIFDGSSVQLAGFSVEGLTNAAHRITDTAGNFGGGDFGTDTNGHKTITGMILALQLLGFYGPYGCYVSPVQYGQLLGLTGTNKNETQLSVILATIPNLRFVKPSNSLPDGELVVFQLSRDVIDLASSLPPTAIQWQTEGGEDLGIVEFRVLTISTVRIKFDINNKCGVAHATGA